MEHMLTGKRIFPITPAANSQAPLSQAFKENLIARGYIKEEKTMGIAGVSIAPGGNTGIGPSQQDSFEINIRKQITQLEEKMKDISEDEEKTAEQKTKERQAAQEQLQNLNNELRQHRLQKQQEEAAKKQAAAKQAMEDAEPAPAPAGTAAEPAPVVFGDKETGVMISLSATKEQLAGMVRIRTRLEGKQRTAESEEERAALQKKINNLSRGIGQKATATKAAISDYHKTAQNDEAKKTAKTEPKKNNGEIFWADTKPPVGNTAAADTATYGNNRPFENISISIN